MPAKPNGEPLMRSDWTAYCGEALFFEGAENRGIEACVIDPVGGINKEAR